AVDHYLPRLERCANFLDTRRDPATNLYLAGAAGNLLAPSFAGYKKPDGTYDKAYLAGLSVTTIAALNRLIELERFAGRTEQAALYAGQRELAIKGLPQLLGPDGCFIKSLDPDGTRHGVFGADRYGYFEAVPNHDAVCFRVVDDPQAERICDRIAAIPGLRPHDLIITNYPSLDDMYEQPAGLWGFGTWVNGGHWSTCEARMIMAWYRVGRPEEARKAMEAYLRFARQFRIDNPLVEFGGAPYQPKEPINTVYDTIGIPAAMVRGLFEYLYSATALTLVPHVPAGITALEQRFAVRFGAKRVWLSTFGSGPVTGVTVNGKPLTSFNHEQVKLAYEGLPAEARVTILLGGAKPAALPKPAGTPPVAPPWAGDEDRQALGERATRLRSFIERVGRERLGARYETAHAKLAVEFIDTVFVRARRQAGGTIKPLAEPASQQAADQLYLDTANKLCDGFEKVVQHYRDATDPARKRIFELWRELSPAPGWTNIRSMGAKQTFRKRDSAWRMSLDGGVDASCGWAYDLPEAVVLPEKARLLIRLNGSPGARFFADLMASDGKPVFQTRWQATPEQPLECWFELPAGATLSQVILYAQTPGGPVWNDFREVSVRDADGKVLCAPVR
ncbi:MAG: hypothetical protein HYU66_27400, partial [Armatimonadetes bacterium]|nr:hypothetical protein [Armatimonadota bacterium]